MFSSIRMIMNSGTILGYFLQVVPITAIVAIIYCIFREIMLKRRNEEIIWWKEILRLIFVCYITGLINLIVMPANFWLHIIDGIAFGWWNEILPILSLGEVNITPSVIRWLAGELTMGSWVKQMLVGNIAMFFPLGFLLPFVTDKVNDRYIWGISVIIPLTMEGLQLIFGRSFDIDDLICNFIGIMLGYLLAKTLKQSK